MANKRTELQGWVPPKDHGDRAAWIKDFCDALREQRSITHACHVMGISRQTAYRQRKADMVFRLAWDDAIETNIDDLEAAWFRRAIDGEEEQKVALDRNGNPVELSVRKIHFPRMAEFLLKANRRDKYGERAIGMTMQERIEAMALAVQAARAEHPEATRDGSSGGQGKTPDAPMGEPPPSS